MSQKQNRTGGFLQSRPALLWILLLVLLIASALFSLFCGRFGLAPSGVVRAVFMGSESSDLELNIVRSIRMPRIILVILVGGGLAISGAAFQGIFQVPPSARYSASCWDGQTRESPDWRFFSV